MRYFLLLLLLTGSVFAKGLEGSWLFAAKNRAIVRIFQGNRFYSLIVDSEGATRFYGCGTFSTSKDYIEYTYLNAWPQTSGAKNKMEREEVVALRLDSFDVRLQEIGVLRFSKLVDINVLTLNFKKLTGPLIDLSDADQVVYKRLEADKYAPVYPSELRRQQAQGFVIAEIVIDQRCPKIGLQTGVGACEGSEQIDQGKRTKVVGA